jgi:diguanylate cyclase (GGDEF)-like protein
MHATRILVVEDEVLVGEELRERLTHLGLTVDGPVRSGTEAVTHVKNAPPDLVLMDIRLAGSMDGIDAARSIRNEYDVPIVFVTAYSDDATIERAKLTEPFGFLPKPVSEEHLKTTIAMALHRYQVERHAKEYWAVREKGLREEATRDPLTGLWNRRRILEMLEDELARANRDHRSLAVFMIDMDLFKAVNDTHGHLAGDAVLKEAARRMQRVIRRYDALGRYAGDEFLLVSTSAQRGHARETATRLRDAVSATPICVGSESIAVTVSIGICARRSVDGLDATMMVDCADHALYESKAAGRDRFLVAQPMDEQLMTTIRAEFRDRPGLRLTIHQAQRLWALDKAECKAVLDALIESHFLTRTRSGAFVRE